MGKGRIKKKSTDYIFKMNGEPAPTGVMSLYSILGSEIGTHTGYKRNR